jgi:hypothetical protein
VRQKVVRCGDYMRSRWFRQPTPRLVAWRAVPNEWSRRRSNGTHPDGGAHAVDMQDALRAYPSAPGGVQPELIVDPAPDAVQFLGRGSSARLTSARRRHSSARVTGTYLKNNYRGGAGRAVAGIKPTERQPRRCSLCRR